MTKLEAMNVRYIEPITVVRFEDGHEDKGHGRFFDAYDVKYWAWRYRRSSLHVKKPGKVVYMHVYLEHVDETIYLYDRDSLTNYTNAEYYR